MSEWTYILIAWNVIALLFMGLDKLFAIYEKRRISEQTLLTLAFAMGGLGSLLGSIIPAQNKEMEISYSPVNSVNFQYKYISDISDMVLCILNVTQCDTNKQLRYGLTTQRLYKEMLKC
jgi:hypothetical protein